MATTDDLDLSSIYNDVQQLKALVADGADIDAYRQKITALTDHFGKLKDSLPDLTKNVKDLLDNSDDLEKLIEKMPDKFGDFTSEAKNLKDALADNKLDVANKLFQVILQLPFTEKLLPIPGAFNAIGAAASQSGTQISDMVQRTGKSIDMLADAIGLKFAKNIPGIKQAIEKIQMDAPRLDAFRSFENGYIAAASAAGDFSSAMKDVGTDLSGLSLKAEAYAATLYKVQISSNLTAREASELAVELRTIPGALDNFGGSTEKAVSGMSHMDAVVKVALGTGQTNKQVVDQLSFAYNHLGTTGKQALEEVARMQSVSAAIGMPLEQMRKYTNQSAESFKLLGDNTQGALNIMSRFGPAFKSAGMGPEAIQEMVSGVTQGLKGMSVASEAFLSQQSGGPGGLQGSFQIEMLKRQGKIDEVYKMVEDNLKKSFGGKIVSSEDATKSQGAASQYYKQITMLQSPAFGNIAKDKDTAMNIADALAKGKTGMPEGLKSPEQALSGALDLGKRRQDRQVSPGEKAVLRIQSETERIAALQTILVANTARNNPLTGADSPLGHLLQDSIKQAELSASRLHQITGKGEAGGKPVSESIDDIMGETREGMGKLVDAFNETKPIAKEKVGEAKNYVKELMDKQSDGKAIQHRVMNNHKPITPTQYAQHTVDGADRAAADRAKSPGARTAGTPGQKIDVHVQATCTTCQRKIAHEEAVKVSNGAIDTYHRDGNASVYHSTQQQPPAQ